MTTTGPCGVFAGLATLDVIHRIDAPPGPDQKITARAQFVAAGGPAANAAVTFAALGGRAVLLTALGTGALAAAITAELAGRGVEVYDIAPELADAAPVSSVAVLESTGERSVIGGDAAAVEAPAPDHGVLRELLAGADVALLDGHHPALARAVLAAAHAAAVPTVLDAGRWKPVMADLVGGIDDVVASAVFRTPDAATAQATLDDLHERGTRTVVFTAGAGPIRWSQGGRTGEIAPPQVEAVDTLGAGDVFHGAYAHALAEGASLEQRITRAAEVAALRIQHAGPRTWLDVLAETLPDLPALPTAEGRLGS